MSLVTVAQAAELLRGGGVVAIPTETVYGLAANALDPHAVARIFELKARPRFDPLIVHIANITQLDSVAIADGISLRLARRFWPGPLTLVLPKRACIPEIVTAGLDTVAVRIPRHPLTETLLNSLAFPLAAPSANPFGYISPTRAEHVQAQLGSRIDGVLDGGPCSIGVESTIVQVRSDGVHLLRPGGVSIEELEREVGKLRITSSAHASNMPQIAPGQLARHYAPTSQLVIIDEGKRISPIPPRAGLLAFRSARHGFAQIQVLSPQGSLNEAATRLFAALRELDEAKLDVIYAEAVPEHGLGLAIMDRLRRASAIREGNTPA